MSKKITEQEVTEAHKLIMKHMDQLISGSAFTPEHLRVLEYREHYNDCVALYIRKMEDKFPHLKQDASPALTIVPDSDTVN